MGAGTGVGVGLPVVVREGVDTGDGVGLHVVGREGVAVHVICALSNPAVPNASSVDIAAT